MLFVNAPVHGITDEFVARLAQRAEEAERLHRLPAHTVAEFKDTGMPSLLLPRRFGEPVSRALRATARMGAAHTGASAHFVTNPLPRAKCDVDIVFGHVVFDYETSRELAGALAIGARNSPIAMV